MHVHYTEENIDLLTKKLESYGELVLCYEIDQLNPVLVTKSRMFTSPFTFRRYLIQSCTANHATNVEVQLTSGTHMIQFINAVFCVNKMTNNPAYTREDITSKDIFTSILPYTDIFDDKTVLRFTQWCRTNKVEYISSHRQKAKTRCQYQNPATIRP